MLRITKTEDTKSMKKYLKSLRLGLTISTALVLVGNQVAYAEETNTATTQASPAATSESTTTTAPTTPTATPTAPVTGTQSLPSAISTPSSTSVSTASSGIAAVDNIVDIGGWLC